MIYYMICWLATCEWIFAPPSTLSKSTLYQISNSLKTENSLTVLPRLLSVFRTESRRRRSSAKKKMKIKKNTSLLPKAGQKVSMYQCWKEKLDTIQWAPYRLSLLFPKFKALQFHDLESRIRANFCAVSPPPKKMCTIEPLCRPRSLPLLPMPPHRASFLQ
jgi:hypothetical protein